MRVLLSAYACEPNRGSEPDIGWQWALAYRDVAELWVLTRANNRSVIEAWEKSHGATGIHWLWVDAPEWVLRLKKRLGRPGILLYYWLWQWFAACTARVSEERDGPFAWAHQLTMNGFREPGRLDRLRAPLVWGPIGGLQNSDWALSRLRGRRAAMLEWLRSRVNDATKVVGWRSIRAVRSRALVIGANHESMDWIRRWRPSMPSLQLLEIGAPRVEAVHGTEGSTTKPDDLIDPRRILWAGNNESRKNPEFALLAWNRLHAEDPGYTLTLLGLSEKRQDELRRWAAKRGIRLGNSVTMIRWLSLEELSQQYQKAGQFWFTSYRDTSGTVALWALAHGVPCIAFKHQGAEVMLADGRGLLVEGQELDDRLENWCACSRQVTASNHPRCRPIRPFDSPHIEWAPKPGIVCRELGKVGLGCGVRP